jgi:hypothetical protein
MISVGGWVVWLPSPPAVLVVGLLSAGLGAWVAAARFAPLPVRIRPRATYSANDAVSLFRQPPGRARDRKLVDLAIAQVQQRLAGLRPAAPSSAAQRRSLRSLRLRLVWVRWTGFLDAPAVRRFVGVLVAGRTRREWVSPRLVQVLTDTDRIVHWEAR